MDFPIQGLTAPEHPASLEVIHTVRLHTELQPGANEAARFDLALPEVSVLCVGEGSNLGEQEISKDTGSAGWCDITDGLSVSHF